MPSWVTIGKEQQADPSVPVMCSALRRYIRVTSCDIVYNMYIQNANKESNSSCSHCSITLDVK